MALDKEQTKMVIAKEILDELERLSFDKSISDEERKVRWETVTEQVEELQALRNNNQSAITKSAEAAPLNITLDRIEKLEKMIIETKIDLDIIWNKQAKLERELLRLRGIVS